MQVRLLPRTPIWYTYRMPEKDKKLDEIYKLVRANNKMLRGMKRAAFWGTVLKLIIYAVLLGVPVYLYFTIFQPILAELLNAYAQLQETGAQIQETGNQLRSVTDGLPLDRISEIFKKLPGVGQ